MNASTDRNLLFGILALQMDFIDREQLVAAMNAWVLEKGKPLGEILSANGALAQGDRDVLEPMVERHIQNHENKPEVSLAALSSIGSVRDELISIADPEVEASLALVSAAPDGYETTQSWSVGEATSAGQRFRILRPHARGGLGKVSVAHDNELNREVALKEIQENRADDPNSRARFVMEAEITGGLVRIRLRHPPLPAHAGGSLHRHRDGGPAAGGRDHSIPQGSGHGRGL